MTFGEALQRNYRNARHYRKKRREDKNGKTFVIEPGMSTTLLLRLQRYENEAL